MVNSIRDHGDWHGQGSSDAAQLLARRLETAQKCRNICETAVENGERGTVDHFRLHPPSSPPSTVQCTDCGRSREMDSVLELILKPVFGFGSSFPRELRPLVAEVDFDFVERPPVNVRSSTLLGELSTLAGQQSGVDEFFDSTITRRDRDLDIVTQCLCRFRCACSTENLCAVFVPEC